MKRRREDKSGQGQGIAPVAPSLAAAGPGLAPTLPPELIASIVRYLVRSIKVNGLPFVLNPQELSKLRLVNKDFNKIIDDLDLNVNKPFPSPPEQSPSATIDPFEQIYIRESQRALKDHFKVFDAMSSDILETFPPREWAYVALGRSPTPLLGQLGRRCPSAQLINLPLGRISSGLTEDQAKFHNDRAKNHIFRHFEQFVAPEKLGGRNKLLVLDYSSVGNALYTVYHWLNAFYAQKETSVEVAVYSISKEEPLLLSDDSNDYLRSIKHKPMPREHVRFAGDKKGIDELMNQMMGGELKKLSIDLYDSLSANDLTEHGKASSDPKWKNFYRLLRLLREAEEQPTDGPQ